MEQRAQSVEPARAREGRPSRTSLITRPIVLALQNSIYPVTRFDFDEHGTWALVREASRPREITSRRAKRTSDYLREGDPYSLADETRRDPPRRFSSSSQTRSRSPGRRPAPALPHYRLDAYSSDEEPPQTAEAFASGRAAYVPRRVCEAPAHVEPIALHSRSISASVQPASRAAPKVVFSSRPPQPKALTPAKSSLAANAECFRLQGAAARFEQGRTQKQVRFKPTTRVSHQAATGSGCSIPRTPPVPPAFIAGAAAQQAHRASDLAAQAANHALQQQQAADQARPEAGWVREEAVREVSGVRVQTAQLASQAQQAVQVAQQSEAQARQLIEQTRQEAIGHVENARQAVNATQQDAQHEVHRGVQEAQQAILQNEQTIASQEQTIRGLSQENSVMHQRLGDLERVVAALAQQARATPVPVQESPPKAATIAETATEPSAAKASSQGTIPPRIHQPVGAPQVSDSQGTSGVFRMVGNA